MSRLEHVTFSARSRARFLALCLGLVVCVPGSGLAQPRQDDGQAAIAARARRRFEAGVALFQEGNPQGALLEFEASMRLRPLAVVQFNIAQALKVLLRYEDAIVAYQIYLQMADEETPAERRQDVEVTIARLRQSIAHITVRCAPEGAELRVDGRPSGHLPLDAPVSVAAGRHEVELRAPGRTTASRSVEVVGGATARVCLELAPAAALRADDGSASRSGGGILGQWWFWAAAGAVIAGGVTAAVLLSSPTEGEPYHGNVDPELVTAIW